MSVLMAMSMPMAAMLFTQLGRGSLPLQFILLIVGAESNEPEGCMYFVAFCILSQIVNSASAQQPGSVQYNTQVLPANGIVDRRAAQERWGRQLQSQRATVTASAGQTMRVHQRRPRPLHSR